MTDQPRQDGGGAGFDPWAPPADEPDHKLSLDKGGPATGSVPPGHAPAAPPAGAPGQWPPPASPFPAPDRSGPQDTPPYPQGTVPPSVHDQATMAAVPGGDFGAPGAVPPVPATPAASYPPPGAPGAYPPPGASAPYAGQTPTGYPQGPGGYGYPGQPQGYGGGWPGMPMAPQNQLGTAAMVLGILSICLFCVYGVLSLILGIIAVVLGVQGKKRADRGEATNRGQAQAGLITGVIGIVIGVAVITSLIVAFVYAARHDDDGGVGDDPYYNSAPRISAPYQPQG